jgi:subtilisin family serine protease
MVPMIIVFIIALIMLCQYKGNRGSINNVDYIETGNIELIVLFNKIPNEEELYMLLEDYEHSANIVKCFEDYALISISDDKIYQDLLNHLDNHPLIRLVEPNGSIHLMQYTNDTYSSTQWPIYNPGYYSVIATNGMKEVAAVQDMDMDITEAWLHMSQEAIKRREVVVAIIDTGIDNTHPDLAENIWVNQYEIPGDGIDNDRNGYVDDIYGWDFYNDDSSVSHYKYDGKAKMNLSLPEDNDDHGTHIAGIIGAVPDNGIGIAGIASKINIKLMVLKINGGAEGTGSISDAILAVKYATKMGADICNISWGTNQYSPTLKETIKESDLLFVAAAGNLGQDNDNKPVYPASFKLDNLISVTFIDANGKLTKLSNYGKESVEFAAPGTDIMSTVVGSYKTFSGSSMAAPQVSAVASLLYTYDDNLYPLAVKNIMIKTLKPITGLKDTILNPGIPNAYKALLEVAKTGRDLVPPIIYVGTVYDNDSLLVPINASDEGGSGVRVIRWLAGIRSVEDFNRGTTGLAVDNDRINVSKAGTYTIYASDYAGNESIQIHEVEDDMTPPTISFSYSVSEDYKSKTISVKAVDKQSGIRRIKYLQGNKNASDFLPAGSGTEIELERDKSSFIVKSDGIYTLYAIDNRGNQIVKKVDVKTVLSVELIFTRSDKIMTVGERNYLRAFIKPSNTTDIITYSSSNDRVALINSKGSIVALREGVATITARTNNGQKAVCRIVVLKRAP